MATYISGTTGVGGGGLVSMKPPSIGIPAVDQAVTKAQGEIEKRKRRSSGGSSSQSTQPAPVYESTLLQQSFTSEQARLTAEAQFREKQAQEKALAQRQAQAQAQALRQKLSQLSVTKHNERNALREKR